MSETTSIDLSQKIRLYLEAHAGIKPLEYIVAPEGKAFKDNDGKFTLRSKIRFQKICDGLFYTRGFKLRAGGEVVSEEEALKNLFFKWLKDRGVHKCGRCGGAGGWKGWPDWTCFDCGGNGIDPKFDLEASLDGAIRGEDFVGDYVARQEAKKAQQAIDAENSRKERQEVEARQNRAFLSTHHDIIARARAVLSIIGPTSTTEWAGTIRDFLRGADGNSPSYLQDWIIEKTEQICSAIEKQQIEAERRSAVSQFVGKVGERQEIVARVTNVREFEKEWGTSHLTTLTDDNGNEIVYWNTINLPDPLPDFPKNKRPAAKGERVKFSANVVSHEEYAGPSGNQVPVKQTQVQRATKACLA